MKGADEVLGDEQNKQCKLLIEGDTDDDKKSFQHGISTTQ